LTHLCRLIISYYLNRRKSDILFLFSYSLYVWVDKSCHFQHEGVDSKYGEVGNAYYRESNEKITNSVGFEWEWRANTEPPYQFNIDALIRDRWGRRQICHHDRVSFIFSNIFYMRHVTWYNISESILVERG